MYRRIAFISGLLGFSLFVAAVIIGGALLPAYSHFTQLISESYAIGTPRGPFLRFAFYLPSGALIALFAWSSARALRVNAIGRLGFLGLGVFYGLGTAITAFFPCDAGCNKEFIDPSLSQLIHNLSGFLAYLVTPISLLMIGVALRMQERQKQLGTLGLACGAMAMVGSLLFMGSSHSSHAGLVQRVIEGAILLWITVCAFAVWNSNDRELRAQ